jgi:hypothetical protein
VRLRDGENTIRREDGRGHTRGAQGILFGGKGVVKFWIIIHGKSLIDECRCYCEIMVGHFERGP